MYAAEMCSAKVGTKNSALISHTILLMSLKDVEHLISGQALSDTPQCELIAFARVLSKTYCPMYKQVAWWCIGARGFEPVRRVFRPCTQSMRKMTRSRQQHYHLTGSVHLLSQSYGVINTCSF
jgi:hypothetical protein